VTAQVRAYGAAKEQAARVVEGMGAQYVETTAQLNGLTGNSDESFQPVKSHAIAGTSFTQTTDAVSLAAVHAEPQQFSAMRSTTHAPYGESGSSEVIPRSISLAVEQPPSMPWIPAMGPTEFETSLPLESEVVNATRSAMTPAIAANTVAAGGIEFIAKSKPSSAADPLLREAEPQTHDPYASPVARERTESYLHYGEDGRARFGNASAQHNGEDGQARFGETLRHTEPHPSEQGRYGMPGGAGARATHEKDERGKRPNYLKEPKSVWLSDHVAAPCDGILTPDWADQQ